MATLREYDSVEVYECKGCNRTLVYGDYKLGNSQDFDEVEVCENCEKKVCGSCQSDLALETKANFKDCDPEELAHHIFCDECLKEWSKGKLSLYYYFKHPEKQTCRVCGCDEWNLTENCEEEPEGACYWVEEDLCSACVTKGEK